MKNYRLIAVFLGLACSITPLHGQNAGGDRMVIGFSDSSRPGLVRVNWESGNISVRAHSGKDVIINSRSVPNPPPRSRKNDPTRRIDPVAPGMTVEEDNNVILIARGSGAPGNLEIEVPVKTNISIKTRNGQGIAIEGVDGQIEVSSTNGNVRLTDVTGSIVADTTNGNVVATLRELRPDMSVSFASMNGNVVVTIPGSAKANVKLRTDNGETITDFELLVRPSTIAGRSRLTVGTINGGGPELDLRTLNGNVYVRKGR